MSKKLLLVFAVYAAIFTVGAQADAVDTASINNYVDTVAGLLNNKLKIIGITIVMIFSGIMAWRNASVAPLGWGAAGSLLIGGSDKIAEGLKTLNF